jgi:hypothetical protein
VNDVLFERCSCGKAITGVFPDGFDITGVPGPAAVLVTVCTSCDYVPGFGGPPVSKRNLSLVRNTRWQ